MSVRHLVVWLAATSVVCFPATALAHTPFLGEPSVIASLPGEAHITTSASNAQGGAAVVMFESKIGANAQAVAIRRQGGSWKLSEIDALGAEAVIPVALEDGRFFVLWDAAGTVRAQTFAADGTPGAVATVLSGVTTVISGDDDRAGWVVRSNLAGSVVVAAGGDVRRGGGVAAAAVRDPGGDFSQQTLGAAVPGMISPRTVTIGPLDAAGGVTIGWATDVYGALPGHATRPAAGVLFGPAEPGDAGLAPDGVWPAFTIGDTLVTAQSEVLALDAATASRCPCLRATRIRDTKGRPAATLVLLGTWRDRAWYALRRHRDGTWGYPTLASTKVAAVPIALGDKGAVGFVRATSDTDYSLFRFASRLYVVPYSFSTDTRSPTIRIGPQLTANRRSLLVPVWCDESCTITRLSVGGQRTAISLRTYASAPRPGDLEPYDIGWLRIPRRTGVSSLRIAVAATDRLGKGGSAAAQFRPGRSARAWCRVGAPARPTICP